MFFLSLILNNEVDPGFLLHTGCVLQGMQNPLFKAELMQTSPQWVMSSPDPARLSITALQGHTREQVKLLVLEICLSTHVSKSAKTG